MNDLARTRPGGCVAPRCASADACSAVATQVNFDSSESKWGLTSEPGSTVPPSRRSPAPPGVR